MTAYEIAVRVVLTGVGATMIMDSWSALLKSMGMPTLNYALVGRWVGYLFHGQLIHDGIGKSSPIQGEARLGWALHYVVGLVFAALLVVIVGEEWLIYPTIMPAVVFGIVTVAFPLFIMQPGMGAGIAASKTATPVSNCLRSLITHTVFGLGLFVAAVGVENMLRVIQ